jgi:dTDP-4-amino-4,6-dideoxygalactose transaminase
VRVIANYGSSEKNVNDLRGVNSRLDEIQAAVLNVKLSRLDADNSQRAALASYYLNNIKHADIVLPFSSPDKACANENVWHLFVIRCRIRDTLQTYLSRHGIETAIHYPIPPHMQKAYSYMNGLSFPVTESLHREALSLPVNPVIELKEVKTVVDVLNNWK